MEKRQARHSTMTMMRPVFAEAKAVKVQEAVETAACPRGACARSLEVAAKDGRVRPRERS